MRIRLALLAAACLASATSCGISADAEPRALQVTTTTSTTPTSEPVGDQTSDIYMVTNSALVPIIRRVPARNPTEVMNSLLIPPDETEGDSLSSSIPAATKLLEIRRREDGLVEVDLSADFEDVQGDARVLALGQIVMSLTDLAGVERVQFFVEGEPLQVFSEERGDVEVVSACDYAQRLSNPTDEDLDVTIEQTVSLAQRRQALRDAC